MDGGGEDGMGWDGCSTSITSTLQRFVLDSPRPQLWPTLLLCTYVNSQVKCRVYSCFAQTQILKEAVCWTDIVIDWMPFGPLVQNTLILVEADTCRFDWVALIKLLWLSWQMRLNNKLVEVGRGSHKQTQFSWFYNSHLVLGNLSKTTWRIFFR